MLTLEARILRFQDGDNEEPKGLEEVISGDLDPDEYAVPGGDIVLGDRRFNVYRIEHEGFVYDSLRLSSVQEFTLYLFGHAGGGVWYKYRARCSTRKKSG